MNEIDEQETQTAAREEHPETPQTEELAEERQAEETSPEKRRFDYRHILCGIITLGIVLIGVFRFPYSLERIIESFRDLWQSAKYYFSELFLGGNEVTPTVNDLPKTPILSFIPLPDTWNGFKEKWTAYWRLWATKNNVQGYLGGLTNGLYNVSMAIVVCFPFLLVGYYLLGRYLKTQNNDYDKDSKPLKAYKSAVQHTYVPVRRWVSEFKLKQTDIWETIETYAQLYFIYIVQSSLIISNYSVRTDDIYCSLGNFPMWNSDFFTRDSKTIDCYSRHAHILDFDSLRLGKKVIEENKNADGFEFGVIVITEIGKERGNNLELSEKKKKDETANQKNDLFNSWLKMVRHSATVDNYPFVRVITDEQRPESWGADARDLCEIVSIKESSETYLAMPFFSLAELLYGWLFGKFSNLYYRYRYVRSDNTLPMYLLKSITAKIQHYYTGIYNRFGYCALRVQIESGTQDGERTENKYYLMNKKIYSKRFSTDCFSDFFTEKALRSTVGIDDLREYATEKATFDELTAQNSYFVGDLLNGLKQEKE